VLLVAIETSTSPGTVAIWRDGSAALRPISGAAQGPGILPSLEEALRAAGAALADADGFACGLGPGAFTGLRVGLATAKGLAYALGKPICGVPSLEALACRARPRAQGKLVAACVDARRGEVYAAVFDEDLTRVLAERVVAPEVLAGEISALGRPCLAVGAGAVLYGDRLGVPVCAEPDLAVPEASEIAKLAALRWDSALRGAAAFALEPLYVRPSDAELHASKV
jgi:tRNA threonylcarbamoyladenosine biosynthesis protein TsaB